VCDHAAVTEPTAPAGLHGVRGLLIDLDGVLVVRGRLVPGAREGLARLDAAGFPYIVATNSSLVSRSTLSAQLADGGITVPPDLILTAASASAAYCARRFPGQPLYVMGTPDALSEFEGQRLISYEEAAEPGTQVAAVVVGDAAVDFTARNVQSGFRLIREGARLVAMHKNRWWFSSSGVMLDSGAYVAALEFGTQRRALLIGKPARGFFLEGVRRLREIAADRGRAADSGEALQPGEAPVAPGDVAMVGDDLLGDIRGAQQAGLRGVFVRSGKHGGADLTRLAAEGRRRLPDGDLPSVVEVVEACLERS